MKKLIFGSVSIVSALALLLAVVPVNVSAKAGADQPIPEVDGTYNEPRHPNIKVRVIVHRAKSNNHSKPVNNPPTLVCGLADPDSSSVVPVAGWKLPSNWTYNLNPSSVPSTVGGANLATIAANGFAAWQSATKNKVQFSRAADTSTNRQAYDGQNVVAWGRTSGSALAVTYVRYDTTTHVAVDVDTIVNRSFTWYWSATSNCAYSDVYDAQDILTHELGHWTGLDDTYDSSYQNNTMYGYGSTSEVKKDTLSSGDVAGVHQVYP